jgi:predicted dinucleotide-binding enzyme
MNIGIIGSGRMGTALARLFVGAGHPVRLSNSRGPQSLDALVAELGPLAQAGTPQDVVSFGDVIVLATPWGKTAAAVEGLGPWEGKIVIDTTNNRFGPGLDDVFELGARTSSEVVGELVPRARIVKAFNHQPIPALTEELGPNHSERNALFLAGDDLDAKRVVAELLGDIGGEPFDTGTLRAGGRLQASGGGPLAGHGRLLTPSEARALLAAHAPGSADDARAAIDSSPASD